MGDAPAQRRSPRLTNFIALPMKYPINVDSRVCGYDTIMSFRTLIRNSILFYTFLFSKGRL